MSSDPGRSVYDLALGPVVVRFSDGALRSSSDVNFYRGGRLVLHVKYLPLNLGFALNDHQEDGAWGREVFVECLRIPGRTDLPLLLALDADGGLLLTRPTAPPLPLGDRFDLGGDLAAVAPGSIEVSQAPDDAAVDLTAAPRGVDMLNRLRMIDDSAVAVGCEAAVVSEAGFFVEGWIDDRSAPLVGIAMVDTLTGARAMLPFGRLRRPDVDAHLGTGHPGEFGFWTAALGGADQLDAAALSFVFADGSGMSLQPGPRIRQGVPDFFETLLTSFGRRAVLGNLAARSFADLDGGYGDVLADLHRRIGGERRVTVTTTFGERARQPAVSLVCVLYGLPDFLYLLVAQFARFGTLDDLEFVFVNNSPEIEDVLLRDAELAATVFDAEVKVVGLNGNSGFSHANNVGVAEARARTLAIINPDVFPRDAGAVQRLRELAAAGTGNDVVSGKLYYADGSVMHEGMYFDRDRRLSALCRTPVWTVEHFRKGFPDTGPTAVVEVPAVSGALMVLDRALYERLGGFSTSFIFGHYEDADLCLRAREAGGRVLLDPALAYWHYEGMGSVKKPAHVGSGLYNRWHFARLWGQRLTETAVA